jgi:hypothetical protein
MWEALFGDGCDIDDGEKLAKKYNPVDYADSWLPSFGDHTSSDYPTVWHFFNFGASGSHLHNAPPGLYYPQAGPSYPGVMDFVIMTGAGLSGLSVHASESDGVSHYGQYDDDERSDLAWQAYDIGSIDFSSVDNLARYGWDDRFLASGQTSARGLAWPLHAIGDVTAPHHVVGTTSWGHRPYEDYIDQYFDDLVYFFDGVELQEDVDQRERVLQWAFGYWLSLQQGTDVQQFVTDLGDETRFLVALEGDWPYRDTASIDYHLGSDDAKHMAVEHYRNFDSQIRVHLERAIAASLALLTHASALVVDPGFDPGTKCTGDSHYEMNVGCVPGPAPGPDPILTLPGVCNESDASCQGGGCPDPCTTFADCPTQYDACLSGCCTYIPK